MRKAWLQTGNDFINPDLLLKISVNPHRVILRYTDGSSDVIWKEKQPREYADVMEIVEEIDGTEPTEPLAAPGRPVQRGPEK